MVRRLVLEDHGIARAGEDETVPRLVETEAAAQAAADDLVPDLDQREASSAWLQQRQIRPAGQGEQPGSDG